MYVVGAGDAVGTVGRNQPCVAIGQDDRIILLDCGATSIAAMRRQGLDPTQIVAVVLTSLAPERALGLPFLLLAREAAEVDAADSDQVLTVCGPRGTAAWLDRVLPLAFPETAPPLDVRELDAGSVSTIGAGGDEQAITIATASPRADGDQGHLDVRVTMGGHSVAYPGGQAHPAFAECDLLLCPAQSFASHGASSAAAAAHPRHDHPEGPGSIALLPRGVTHVDTPADARVRIADDGTVFPL